MLPGFIRLVGRHVGRLQEGEKRSVDLLVEVEVRLCRFKKILVVIKKKKKKILPYVCVTVCMYVDKATICGVCVCV